MREHLAPEPRGRAGGHRAAEHPWRRELPAAWRAQVIVPIAFEIHCDAELAAQRVFGRDADGARCYYAHEWMLSEPCSDDDEEYYLRAAAGEAVTAWLLRDERWLVRRMVIGNDACGPGQVFYVLSETMPR